MLVNRIKWLWRHKCSPSFLALIHIWHVWHSLIKPMPMGIIRIVAIRIAPIAMPWMVLMSHWVLRIHALVWYEAMLWVVLVFSRLRWLRLFCNTRVNVLFTFTLLSHWVFSVNIYRLVTCINILIIFHWHSGNLVFSLGACKLFGVLGALRCWMHRIINRIIVHHICKRISLQLWNITILVVVRHRRMLEDQSTIWTD